MSKRERPVADPSKAPLPGRYKEMSGAALGLSLAFEFAAAVALFWFLGWVVDGWLGTEPIFQIVLAVLGWAGGIYHVYLQAERRTRD